MQSLDGKALFELPLTEVADVQGGKEDAIMEFHVDDGTISMTEDALCSVTFVIPDGNPEFQGVYFSLAVLAVAALPEMCGRYFGCFRRLMWLIRPVPSLHGCSTLHGL